MEQAGYYRKYIILQELDPGFGVQRPPEGFARLDGSKEGLTLSLQIRNLREGTEPYTVILVYGKNDETGVIRAGSLEVVSRNAYLQRKLDYEAIQAMGMQPENIQYILIAAEHQERILIPMAGICNKAHPWNESVRQRLLKKEKQQSQPLNEEVIPETKLVVKKDGLPEVRQIQKRYIPEVQQAEKRSIPVAQQAEKRSISEVRQAEKRSVPEVWQAEKRSISEVRHAEKRSGPEVRQAEKRSVPEVWQAERRSIPEVRPVEKRSISDTKKPALDKVENSLESMEQKPVDKPEGKVDDVRLERKLKDAFEAIEPFSNPRHDYAWYRINDLARLSNLLFACNMRIPLFANPKILVGLFKYRHLLAGFYRSDRNDMNYFVLGVPSRDDSEGKPFESISRWVASQNSEYGDMTGYWLVYINLRSGEFVH